MEIKKRFNHPGLIFPDDPNHPDNLRRKELGEVGMRSRRKVIPASKVSLDWGYTTGQIAHVLKVSTSAARQYLHRHQVIHKLVKQSLIGPPFMIWEKQGVLKLVKNYVYEESQIPDGYVMTKEAQMLLGISPATLIRFREQYSLVFKRVRMTRNGASRIHTVYLRTSILDLRTQLRRCRSFASLLTY